MGGTGGGIAYITTKNSKRFVSVVSKRIAQPSEPLIEESLIGWKEYEMEVVR